MHAGSRCTWLRPLFIARAARLHPVKGRSRAFSVSVAGRDITVVDDTYNANPDSMHAAIQVLAELPGRNCW